MTAKPPYRVPTMAEINALTPNGFDAVSTFSGCGGSSLGYRMAGFRVLWASEFVEAARDTYRANAAPYTILDGRDIRDVSGSDILTATGKQVGELDLFDGSPPCASFSTAGKREKGWGTVKKYSDTTQRSDDLFYEYARLIADTQPRTFVAENVSGLVKGTAKGYFKLILAKLQEAGYRVAARVLDAQWLGVPQARQRLIFIGVRQDLGIDPVHPRPLPYRYAIQDAIDVVGGKILSVGSVENGPNFKSPLPRPVDFPSATIGASPQTGNGRMPPSLVRYLDDAGTIQKRKLTIDELRPLGGFPADFALTGTYAQRWERIGRAVPPVMMSHIAAAVRDDILTPLRDRGVI